jgi:tetratricopeptide (TPR) repeat protein
VFIPWLPHLLAGALALASNQAATPVPPAPAPAPGQEGADAQSLLARVDEEWKRRDEPGVIDEIRSQLERAENVAPEDYGVLWRLAQLYFWLSDDPSLKDDEKSRLGKKSWDYGDRAAAANPSRVEGWYFAAVGMGNYSLGIGVLKALGQGVEGKFKERLAKAERIQPRYFSGGIFAAWGRFYFKLPWPKYDARKSEQMLQRALRVNPDNVRGRVFLAELHEKEGNPEEARKLLQEAIAHQPGSYDPPEERRSQGLARELLARMK